MAGFEDYLPDRETLRPNRRDADPSRGPLAYVSSRADVMDFGAPKDTERPWMGTRSPASPTFVAPEPDKKAKGKAPDTFSMQPTIKRP